MGIKYKDVKWKDYKSILDDSAKNVEDSDYECSPNISRILKQNK